ncbi:MAG: YafY family protein [Devosia sp.]
MTNRAGRLLSLLQALREQRRPVAAATLAKRFGVSERTIYRDLDVLADLGAPVEGEAGVGFILRPGFFLPPLALTRDEADAVMLGLRFVTARADPAFARAARSALAKIGASMDDDAETAMNTNGLTVGRRGEATDERVGPVRDALARERKLQLAYCDAKGRPSERIVWPVALGFFDGLEMLAAWCEMREAFRHFRVDRMGAVDVLAERLPVPRRILLAEYRAFEQDADL